MQVTTTAQARARRVAALRARLSEESMAIAAEKAGSLSFLQEEAPVIVSEGYDLQELLENPPEDARKGVTVIPRSAEYKRVLEQVLVSSAKLMMQNMGQYQTGVGNHISKWAPKSPLVRGLDAALLREASGETRNALGDCMACRHQGEFHTLCLKSGIAEELVTRSRELNKQESDMYRLSRAKRVVALASEQGNLDEVA